MNTIREIQKINEQELQLRIAGTPASWHAKYARSAWVYVGNLDHALTEGDIICVLSQYGEIEDCSLIREEDTGKSRGFAFCKYEDARSCVLAVDNLCGVEICGRTLRIDHVENYRLPKHLLEKEESMNRIKAGHAYEGVERENEYSLEHGQDLFAPVESREQKSAENQEDELEAKRKRKEERRRIREERERRRSERERKRADHGERKHERRARDSDSDDDRRHRKKKKKSSRHYRSRSRSPASH